MFLDTIQRGDEQSYTLRADTAESMKNPMADSGGIFD